MSWRSSFSDMRPWCPVAYPSVKLALPTRIAGEQVSRYARRLCSHLRAPSSAVVTMAWASAPQSERKTPQPSYQALSRTCYRSVPCAERADAGMGGGGWLKSKAASRFVAFASRVASGAPRCSASPTAAPAR